MFEEMIYKEEVKSEEASEETQDSGKIKLIRKKKYRRAG